MISDDLLMTPDNTLIYFTKNTPRAKKNQSTAFAANWKGSVMEPSIDTTDVREPRPFKINAYVHPDRVAYLKKLEYPKKILRYIYGTYLGAYSNRLQITQNYINCRNLLKLNGFIWIKSFKINGRRNPVCPPSQQLSAMRLCAG